MSEFKPDRFWSKVTKSDGCWEWSAQLRSNGYGCVTRLRKRYQAHRVAWEFENGPIPSGLWVLHRCDNRKCVRPDHLFLGTNQDNQQDASVKGRNIMQRHPERSTLWARNARMTHCKNGHPFVGDNVRRRSNGGRYCYACMREQSARRNAQLRQARQA